jgi:hypothetical protein
MNMILWRGRVAHIRPQLANVGQLPFALAFAFSLETLKL